MGVQATMTIGDKKGATVVAVASGAAVFPSAGDVSIVTIMAASDLHRQLEIQRCVNELIHFAKQETKYTQATSFFLAMSLLTRRDMIQSSSTVSGITTGEIAILINGTDRTAGDTLIIVEAYKQLLDFMRESGQLVVAA